MAKPNGINIVWGLVNQAEANQKVNVMGLNSETDDVYFNPTSPATITRCVFETKLFGFKLRIIKEYFIKINGIGDWSIGPKV